MGKGTLRSVAKSPKENKSHKERSSRRTAYLPVKLKKSTWFPLFQMDAQLIDLSPEGAKIQCGRDVQAWQGSSVWIEIPLLNPTDSGETALVLRTECRWYNEEALSMGISFVELTDDEQHLLVCLIDDLKSVGRLAC